MCVMLMTIEEFVTSALDVHGANAATCWTPNNVAQLIRRCTENCQCSNHDINASASALELQMIVYLIMRNARYGKPINIATVLTDAASTATDGAHVQYAQRQVYHGGYHLSGLMRRLVTQRLPLVNAFFRLSRQTAMLRDFRELALHSNHCTVPYCQTQRGIVPWSCSQLTRFQTAVKVCQRCTSTVVCTMHCDQCRLILGVDAPTSFVNTVAFPTLKRSQQQAVLMPKRVRT